MKKICVFLMFVSVVCGGVSSYATTDIAADAENSECVENITGTYSGDANFKAKWTPNNIQLRWYNNNTLMQGVNTESNTCNYGTTLTIPTTPPERTGYIFDGWKVRPTYDFSKLATGGTYALTERGQERWAKAGNGTSCFHALVGAGHTTYICKRYAEYNDLNQHEWKAKFSTGMLYGSGKCSAYSGNINNYQWNIASSFATTDELSTDGGYCWCQITGWKPNSNNTDTTLSTDTIYANSNNISYGNTSVPGAFVWVYNSSQSGCNRDCASACAFSVLYYPAFRRALFVGDGN